MKRVYLVLLPCILAIALVGLFLHPPFAHGAPASPASCGTSWTIVNSPNKDGKSPNFNTLGDVAAISDNDIWAVGDYSRRGLHGFDHALTEHWNGTTWSIVPATTSATGEFLDGVAAISSNDVWAVGGEILTVNKTIVNNTLTEHWNGTAWSSVPSPTHRSSTAASLISVTAISTNDVWTVGWIYNTVNGNLIKQPLMEHWDGTAWSDVSFPQPSGSVSLVGVTALSSTDVWAVGGVQSPTDPNVSQPLIEHWDGTQWTIVANPATSGFLSGISALSATDIWTVGGSLIEHWDGTQWTTVPNPSGISLGSVSAVSTDNAWAVGDGGSSGKSFLHWNGKTWAVASSPHLQNPLLSEITLVPGTTHLWTVGWWAATNSSPTRTLTENHC